MVAFGLGLCVVLAPVVSRFLAIAVSVICFIALLFGHIWNLSRPVLRYIRSLLELDFQDYLNDI
jgi:hypothetical protein